MNIDIFKVIELPKISDPRGHLTLVEPGRQIPFDSSRIYYLYYVSGGGERGGSSSHAPVAAENCDVGKF